MASPGAYSHTAICQIKNKVTQRVTHKTEWPGMPGAGELWGVCVTEKERERVHVCVREAGDLATSQVDKFK